jgi:cytosine deaminase
MSDLLIRNATLVDGTNVDIAIEGDRIRAIGPSLAVSAKEVSAEEVIDAAGALVSAPFVDAHFHMDATLSYGIPRVNESGTLLEGIALWGELKETVTIEAMVERALQYCQIAAGQGLLAVRSHVDVCDDRLLGVQALLDVREQVKSYMDLQLVAFPQDGWFRADAEKNVHRALDMGVDVVGGIPHFERTMADGTRSVIAACELAAERGLRVDLHCDESDDPHSRHIETLAAETHRLGMAGRVTGSHLASMHSMDNYYATKLIALIAESGVSAVANPLINITLQGRLDTYPKRRGMTRVPELLAAGVDVAFGQDCVMDPWYSLGTGDMLDPAYMGLHVGQMTSDAAMRQCFEMVTTTPARMLGLDDLGLREGALASLVILDASNPVDAIRRRPVRTHVVSRGRVIAKTSTPQTALNLG